MGGRAKVGSSGPTDPGSPSRIPPARFTPRRARRSTWFNSVSGSIIFDRELGYRTGAGNVALKTISSLARTQAKEYAQAWRDLRPDDDSLVVATGAAQAMQGETARAIISCGRSSLAIVVALECSSEQSA